MTSTLRNALTKTTLVLTVAVFFIPLPGLAAGLTTAQSSAILNVLASFGVSQSILAEVSAILMGTAPAPAAATSTQSTPAPTSVAPAPTPTPAPATTTQPVAPTPANTPKATASLNQGLLFYNAGLPISGSAANTSSVEVVMSDPFGATVFDSGALPVTNGTFAVTGGLPTTLVQNTYTIKVYDAEHNLLTQTAWSGQYFPGTPSCLVTLTPATRITLGQQLTVTWTTPIMFAATTAKFETNSGEFVPVPGNLAPTGSTTVTVTQAPPSGNSMWTIVLSVTGLGGTGICSTSFNVSAGS